jgi:hypothetical protein
MNTNHTNDQLDARVETIYLKVLETEDHFSELTTDEITLVCAKLAAKFATYAGDAINF